MVIRTYNWQIIKRRIPNEFMKLIKLCEEYQELCAYSQLIMYHIDGVELASMQILIGRILTEYRKIVQYHRNDEHELKELDRDIETTLTGWFDKNGRIKNLTNEFIPPITKGNLEFYLPLFRVPFDWFIQSRIYDCLVEAIEKNDNWYEIFKSRFKDIEILSKPELKWSDLMKELKNRNCEHLIKIALLYKEINEYRDFLNRIYPSKPNDQDITNIYGKVNELIKEFVAIYRHDHTFLKYFEREDCEQRTYLAIIKTKKIIENGIINDFVISTIKKAGILPEVEYKEGSKLTKILPSRSKDDDEI